MSTRSRIGMLLDDGTVKHCYCHFDGYPEGVGKTLEIHYNDIEKVKELLIHGDISYLESKINPEGEHTFDNPEKGVTVYYGRDRNSSDIDSVVTTMDEFLSIKYTTCIAYLYLFSDGQWMVKDMYDNQGWNLIRDSILQRI